MPKVYTLYLSTQTPAGNIYAPLDATNKSAVRWSINWDALLGFPEDKAANKRARLTFELSSLSQAGVLTYAANSGFLAISGLPNLYSNSQNGLVLGFIHPANEVVAGGTNHTLYGNTLETKGVETLMPYGYGDITVLLEDRSGNLQPNTVDYQLIIQFEME
jgi:hypothetical protein